MSAVAVANVLRSHTWIAALEVMDVEGPLEQRQKVATGLRHLRVEQGRVVAPSHAVKLPIEHNDWLPVLRGHRPV